MSTEAAAPAVPTIPFTLTRGGWYLIEGVLQRTEYTTKPGSSGRASRLRRKLRDQNPAKSGDLEFEPQLVRKATESDIEWANRQVEHGERFQKWQDGKATIELTQKERDFLVTRALKWAFDNRDKVFQFNNDHTLSIIDAFSIEDGD